MRSRRSAIRALVVLAVLALGVLGFAGVASANGGNNGPTTPKVSDPVTGVGGVNEIEVIVPTWQAQVNLPNGNNQPNGGTWTIKYTNNSNVSTTSGGIARDALAADIQTVMDGLVGAGNSSVVAVGNAYGGTCYGDCGKAWQITFQGTLANTNIKTALSITTTGLFYNAPANASYAGSVYTQQDGVPIGNATPDVSPHGGYATSTAYCLQCHAVHGGAQWQGGAGGDLVNINHTLPSGEKGISDYALLAQPSVTDVCATCHSLFGTAAPATGSTGPTPQDGGGLGRTAATASVRTAYDSTGSAVVSEHAIGYGAIGSSQTIPLGSGVPCLNSNGAVINPPDNSCSQITEGGWSYSWKQSTWNGTTGGPPNANSTEPAQAGTAGSGQTGWGNFGSANTNTENPANGGGLYCGSCHTPHGDFGQSVNTRWIANSPDNGGVVAAVANDTNVSGSLYLEKGTGSNGGTSGVWYTCNNATGGVVNKGAPDGCKPWTTTDANGQTGIYLYGYKILSAFPNHTYAQAPRGYLADNHSHDVAVWCGTCHTDAMDVNQGGSYHNHPTGCTACHGSPSTISGTGSLVVGDGTKPLDFPHTSANAMFLKALPDGLCISCHKSGALP